MRFNLVGVFRNVKGDTENDKLLQEAKNSSTDGKSIDDLFKDAIKIIQGCGYKISEYDLRKLMAIIIYLNWEHLEALVTSEKPNLVKGITTYKKVN